MYISICSCLVLKGDCLSLTDPCSVVFNIEYILKSKEPSRFHENLLVIYAVFGHSNPCLFYL